MRVQNIALSCLLAWCVAGFGCASGRRAAAPAATEKHVAPMESFESAAVLHVGSFEELKSQNPIRVEADGPWDIRLALADSGEDGGPWKYLLCLATWRGEGWPRPRWSEPQFWTELGPVCFFDASNSIPEGMRMLRARWQESADRSNRPRKHGEVALLYAAVLPVAWEGKYDFRIVTRGGHPLARAQFEISTPDKWYWQTVVSGSEGQDGVFHAVEHLSNAAAPWIDSSVPILAFDEGNMTSQSLNGSILASREMTKSLPTTLPLAWEWCNVPAMTRIDSPRYRDGGFLNRSEPDEPWRPVTLSLENGVAEIHMPRAVVHWLDYMMLARWWVNGKPVPAKMREGAQDIMLLRDLTAVATLKARIALPAGLGELTVGDRVAFEVLYCPDGYSWIPKERRRGYIGPQLSAQAAPLPMQSNRVEFAVTQAMLDERAARGRKSAEAESATPILAERRDQDLGAGLTRRQ